jgi:hypothetical protein
VAGRDEQPFACTYKKSDTMLLKVCEFVANRRAERRNLFTGVMDRQLHVYREAVGDVESKFCLLLQGSQHL